MSSCYSCRLCDLACSAWRFSRDGACAPRAMVLMVQRQQPIAAQQLEYCTLCGACDAACPVGLRPMATILNQRSKRPAQFEALVARAPKRARSVVVAESHAVSACFPAAQWMGEGATELVQQLADGKPIDSQRLQYFVAPLASASVVIVANGLLYYALRCWLPDAPLVTLAEALLPTRAHGLRAGDLLLLDAAAFHADHDRLLPLMQRAVERSGAWLNLDLQRLAMPLRSYRSDSKQALQERWRWISRQRAIKRVVVESWEERLVAEAVSGLPTVWLGDLKVA